MPRRDPRLIGYLLLDASGRYHWASPGYRPLSALRLIPGTTLWAEFAPARRAGLAAVKRYNLLSPPVPTRCFLSL